MNMKRNSSDHTTEQNRTLFLYRLCLCTIWNRNLTKKKKKELNQLKLVPREKKRYSIEEITICTVITFIFHWI